VTKSQAQIHAGVRDPGPPRDRATDPATTLRTEQGTAKDPGIDRR